jgi:hypothetical protein
MRSARGLRFRLPAIAAAVAALLAGCSSGTPTVAGTSAAPSPTSTPSATATATLGPQLDGSLVIASCTGTGPGSSFAIYLIDPNNGITTTTRSFPLPQGGEAAAQCDSLFGPAGKTDVAATGWAARSLFDRGFRHLAVVVGHSDGSESVGYVDEKGALVEVVGVDPNHATTLTARREARFGRTDDTLWFLQGGDVYQVSSVVGSTPTKRTTVAPGSQVFPVTGSVYALGGNGRPDLLPSPDGQLWARLENPPKGQIEPTGFPHTLVLHKPPAADGAPGAVAASQRFDTQCFPDQWISNTSLLCLTKNGVTGERFAVVDASGSSLKLRLVMPENSLTIGDPVILGANIFFLGSRGGATGLYRVPLAGGDPLKVTDLPAGFSGHLIGTADG